VRAGIVVARGNAQSEREGEVLQRLLGAGLKIGNVTLKPVLVYVNDVGRADVGLFILTAGLDAAAAPVGAVAAQKQIACMTTDLGQVRSGRCVMGVRSQPKIEILVNRTAAQQAKLSFSSVFRMMITEI
jgi:altronate dehydratase